MFLGRINNFTTTSANEIIPFATILNTNNKTSNVNGVVSLRKAGIYNVDASINVEANTGTTPAPITVTIYADGIATTNTATATPAAVLEPFSVSLTDAIRVTLAEYPNVATIDLRVDTTGINVDGTLRIEYLQ